MSVVPLNYILKQIGVQFEPQGPGTQLSNMDPLRVKWVFLFSCGLQTPDWRPILISLVGGVRLFF